jgi:uncharacterized SAM-binding protein YcdF (DUF218 family)
MHPHSWLVALTYPPVLSVLLLVVATVLLAVRRRRLALSVACVSIAWSVLWSLPVCSEWLRQSLEGRPSIAGGEARLPKADAIVVLGGGAYEYLGHTDLGPDDLVNSRLAAGARAWMAGRAPLIILSGGGRGVHTEARRMAKVIRRWGIPTAALLLEECSHNTRDNAFFTAQLAKDHRLQRVLLVTSALHMPRASLLFRNAGLDVVPVPVAEPDFGEMSRFARWQPAGGALWRSGRALKEYVGLLDARIENATVRTGPCRPGTTVQPEPPISHDERGVAAYADSAVSSP